MGLPFHAGGVNTRWKQLPGKFEAGFFLFRSNNAGAGESGFFPVLGNGNRSLSLFALVGNPADLVSVEFFVEANANNTGAGVADRHHMFISPDFTKFFLRFIAP
jgi:hypothetical protein